MIKILEKSIDIQSSKNLRIDIKSFFYDEPKKNYPQICIEVSYKLYQINPSPEEWQPWIALASLSSLVLNNYKIARSTALISQVYDSLKREMPRSLSEVPKQKDDLTLAYLLKLLPLSYKPNISSSMYQIMKKENYPFSNEDYYVILGESILFHKWDDCKNILNSLSQHEIASYDKTLINKFYPGYELTPTAIVATAKMFGFNTMSLADKTKLFFWPAIESRPNVIPDYWPFK